MTGLWHGFVTEVLDNRYLDLACWVAFYAFGGNEARKVRRAWEAAQAAEQPDPQMAVTT